jgi:hypothetical protein
VNDDHRDEWFDVTLNNPGEDDFSTLCITGKDVVVPLERDVEADPFQDDEVRLVSEDGAYDVTLHIAHDAVEDLEDDRLRTYTFHDVPPGLYAVWVCVGGLWTQTMRHLAVLKRSSYHAGRELTEGDPVAIAPTQPAEHEEDEDHDEPPEVDCC